MTKTIAHFETYRFGPLRDIEPLFDHAVGAAEQREGTVSPSALAVSRLMTNTHLVPRPV